jgi:hypothetical protein
MTGNRCPSRARPESAATGFTIVPNKTSLTVPGDAVRLVAVLLLQTAGWPTLIEPLAPSHGKIKWRASVA